MSIYSRIHFEGIVNQYSDMLGRIAFQRIMNLEDSKDVVQEVFTKLYCTGDVFSDEVHLKAWLIRVTINKCKDINKQFWKRKHVLVDCVISPTLNFNEKESSILEVVCSLKPEYRDVIYLYYYEEYKIPEIARLLNKNINTINSRLQRARKILGNHILEVME